MIDRNDHVLTPMYSNEGVIDHKIRENNWKDVVSEHFYRLACLVYLSQLVSTIMLNYIDYTTILLMLLGLVVVISSLRNYVKYKITDFLLIAIAFSFAFYYGIYTVFFKFVIDDFTFLNAGVHAFLPDVPQMSLRVIYFLNGLCVAGVIFFWSVYWIRSIWIKIPKIMWVLTVGSFILNILIYVPVLLNEYIYLGFSPRTAVLIRTWIYFMPILVYSMLVIPLYRSLNDPMHPTESILKAIKYWRITLISILVYGLSELVWRVSITVQGLHEGNSNGESYYFFAATSSATIVFVFVAYIAVKYPEAILIFDTQVIRCRDLYTYIESQKETKFGTRTNIDGLEEYLKSISKMTHLSDGVS